MIQDVRLAITILGFISFFTCCEKADNSAPKDDCPNNDCEEQDKTSSRNSSGSKSNNLKVGIKVYTETKGGQKLIFDDNKVKVGIYSYNSKNLIDSAPLNQQINKQCLDTFPKAYFKNRQQIQSRRTYFAKLTDTFKVSGNQYYGEEQITILEPHACEWYSTELEVSKVQ